MRLLISLVLLISQLILTASAESFPENASSSVTEFKPVEPTGYRLIETSMMITALANDTARRRRLAPFQLCLLCKCCAAPAATTCSTMPCCFGIDCQLPNKPYGVCAFVPKTCNCTSCAV